MSAISEAGGRAEGACGGSRAALAGLVSLLILAVAPPAAAADPSEAVVEPQAESAAEVRDYWTVQRMREAQPVEHRARRPSRRSAPADAEPTHRSARQAVSATFPGRTHGKVFFTLPDGKFMCSGTVVESGGRNLVVTAGHCVYDHAFRTFATNWMFVPGYRDGQRPYGEWPAERLATIPQFQRDGDDLRYDIGVAVLHRDANGRGVEDVVGAREIAFDQPRDHFYHAFGYPAHSPFNGERLYRCDSPYRGADGSFPPPQPMRIDCEMTAGASGGGWVVNDRTVVSVTSYAYEYPPLLCEVDPSQCPELGKLFGPYFGHAVRELYRANEGWELRCGGRVVDHRGTRRGDQLVGTLGPDVIHGRGGPDVLRGRAGDDVICGGPGADRIFGGPGNNRIFAGPGNDRVLVRSRGRNRVIANRGRNWIRCGPGRDVVRTNHRSRVHRSCNRVIRR